ncbi:MAG: LuxR family transcriptional regulator [Nitrospira sp.]|nr:LuxR family transcriptional regulator [Nitrospira sp.]
MADPRAPFPRSIFRDVAAREMTQILEVLHHISHARTQSDIQRILHLMHQLLPSDRLVAVTGPLLLPPTHPDQTAPTIINHSYPTEWLRIYSERHYTHYDPVIQTWAQTGRTFPWQNLIQNNMNSKTQEVMEEARHYGIRNGIIGGRIDRKQHAAAFIACTGGSHRDVIHYSAITDYLSQELATVLLTYNQTEQKHPNLSEREQEVLSWIKDGYTSRQIALQLHISERTVRFHVERLLSKLHAKTRAQAIEKYYASTNAS